MILSVDVPKKLQTKLDQEKRKTGLSKSYLVRHILLRHYALTNWRQKPS